MEKRTFRQCGLASARATLKHLDAFPSAICAMPTAATLGTMEARGPAGRLKNGFTLLLVSVLRKKFIQAQAGLELDTIHLHGKLLFGVAMTLAQDLGQSVTYQPNFFPAEL